MVSDKTHSMNNCSPLHTAYHGICVQNANERSYSLFDNARKCEISIKQTICFKFKLNELQNIQ